MASIRRALMTAVSALGVAVLSVPAGGQVAPAPVTSAPASAVARAPNVILILADDLGVETINRYGGEYYTPHVDGLARSGVTFRNAHATPICSTSRTRLMTGIENAKNYKAFGYLDPTARTFGNVFRDAGYTTGIVGKWQLSGNGFDGLRGITPRQAGFDESLLWQETAGQEKGSRYWGPTLSLNGKGQIYETGYGPDIMSDFALDFVTRHKDKPFFLYYPMVLVHSPFVPTPDSLTAKGTKSLFAGMVSYMDMLVGKMVQRVHDLGLDDHTIIIFTGDNGTNRNITSWRNGYPIQGGKAYPIERGTHVPFVIAWPGHLPANATRDGLLDFEDVLPTMADLTGHPVAAGSIDGVSQTAVIKGQAASARSWIFEHYAPVWIFPPARFVFDGRYKLYGDGRFVAVDQASAAETEVTRPTAAEAKTRTQFQHILDTQHDGPLDPGRFPMCAGKPSDKPGVSPIIAGCGPLEGGND